MECTSLTAQGLAAVNKARHPREQNIEQSTVAWSLPIASEGVGLHITCPKLLSIAVRGPQVVPTRDGKCSEMLP